MLIITKHGIFTVTTTVTIPASITGSITPAIEEGSHTGTEKQATTTDRGLHGNPRLTRMCADTLHEPMIKRLTGSQRSAGNAVTV
jgi:hypothetical protein